MSRRQITGFSNPTVKALRALRDKKHRKALRQFGHGIDELGAGARVQAAIVDDFDGFTRFSHAVFPTPDQALTRPAPETPMRW